MRHDVAGHPAGALVLECVHRALARPEGLGFTASLLQTVRDLEIRTIEGLYVGRSATYTADTRRLDAVMRRTMLGLYYRENNDSRLPNTHEARVLSVAALETLRPEQKPSLQRFIEFGAAGKLRVFGDRVFVYKYRRLPDTLDSSLWLFQLYERAAFIGYTGPAVETA